MKATQQLHDLGQSLWLDNITRGLLTSGTLHKYIREFFITELTSNPTIFDKAIKDDDFYDAAIRQKVSTGKSGEALFYELALEDLSPAADLLHPVFDATSGMDGWVSMEVSPLPADNTAKSIAAAAQLHARAQRPNLFIKIPGIPAGILAVEESIFSGVLINVTLLFCREQYLAAAEAYMRGIERRVIAGLDPEVGMPEKTLRAFAEHGRVKDVMPRDGGDAEEMLAAFAYERANDANLAAQLQREGTGAFSKSWQELLGCLANKSVALKQAKQAGGRR